MRKVHSDSVNLMSTQLTVSLFVSQMLTSASLPAVQFAGHSGVRIRLVRTSALLPVSRVSR